MVIDDLPLGVGFFLVVDAEGFAAKGAVEFSGGLKDGVTDDLGFDTAGRVSPEKGGAGILFKGEGIGSGGALEGFGGQEKFEQGFGGPGFGSGLGGGDEFGGKPIKEFGVGGGGSGDTEVGSGGDDPGAKDVVPEPVDHNAGSERVVGVGEPLGEFFSSLGAGCFGGEVEVAFENGEAGGRDFVTRTFR